MTLLTSFKQNAQLTIGVELELQLVNLHDFNLTVESKDFLRRLAEVSHPGEIKLEITQAMIEINSSIHQNYNSLFHELDALRNIMSKEANQSHIGICGGGTHPFQKWKKQRITDTERFASISEQYGYLAQQFTVFGQHIHIACPSGDDALYLCHAMARYLPHFVALSAASPFNQGVDTSFDCSRLVAIGAFPLSGIPPWLLTWADFEEYFDKMAKLEIVKSIKDFYWDIRPKPEYGTVEVRICDTPLTMTKAAVLGAYAQMLIHWLLETRPAISQEIYTTYAINRFRAARYGLDAILVDPIKSVHNSLIEDILVTCNQLEPIATKLDSLEALVKIRQAALKRNNGASWLRNQYASLQSLNDTVRMQTEIWAKTYDTELN